MSPTCRPPPPLNIFLHLSLVRTPWAPWVIMKSTNVLAIPKPHPLGHALLLRTPDRESSFPHNGRFVENNTFTFEPAPAAFCSKILPTISHNAKSSASSNSRKLRSMCISCAFRIPPASFTGPLFAASSTGSHPQTVHGRRPRLRSGFLRQWRIGQPRIPRKSWTAPRG